MFRGFLETKPCEKRSKQSEKEGMQHLGQSVLALHNALIAL